jgi:hypothetical protein
MGDRAAEQEKADVRPVLTLDAFLAERDRQIRRADQLNALAKGKPITIRWLPGRRKKKKTDTKNDARVDRHR